MNLNDAKKILDDYDFSDELNEILFEACCATDPAEIRDVLRYFNYDDDEGNTEIKEALLSMTNKELIEYLSDCYHVNFVKLNPLDIPIRYDDVNECIRKKRKFRVTRDADYVVGHLRYGHLEGVIEAGSLEEAKKMIEEGHYDNCLKLVLDDWSVDDIDYGSNPFEYEEIG